MRTGVSGGIAGNGRSKRQRKPIVLMEMELYIHLGMLHLHGGHPLNHFTAMGPIVSLDKVSNEGWSLLGTGQTR